MFGAERCCRLFLGDLSVRPSRMSSSSFGISFSSRNEPLKLALRMLLPEVELIERLELGRIMMSTSSEAPSSIGASSGSFEVC